jgi:hypothetical protein
LIPSFNHMPFHSYLLLGLVTLSTGVDSRGLIDESVYLNHSLSLSGSNDGVVIEVERSSDTENLDLQGPLEGIDRMWEREEGSWHLPSYITLIICYINDSEIPGDNIDVDPNDYILQHPSLLIERPWVGDLMNVPSQLQDNSFLLLPFYNTFF